MHFVNKLTKHCILLYIAIENRLVGTFFFLLNQKVLKYSTIQ